MSGIFEQLSTFHVFKWLLSTVAGELYTAAADAAMASMKGRLANKFYALAEESWAEVEGPEE